MTAAIPRLDKTAEPASSLPVLHLAADLGKSDCKFLYWGEDGDLKPLMLGPNLMENVDANVLHFFELSGELSESAWLQIKERNILVGNSAASYQGSFQASKKETAAYRIATALGLGAIDLGLECYRAVVSVTVPFNEFGSREQIRVQLEEIGREFTVCGRLQQFELHLSFYPEGTGLYLLHRTNGSAKTASRRRLVVLMLGHRNLSLLVFGAAGRLDASLSRTSDSLGFWGGFQADAAKMQVREVDYPALQRALYSGTVEQYSIAEGRVEDYGPIVEVIRSGLMGRLEPFCRDVVNRLLFEQEPTDLFIGGGLAHLLRGELRRYFEQLSPQTLLLFADEAGGQLLTIAERSRGGEYDLARPMRLADVFGLAKFMQNQQWHS